MLLEAANSGTEESDSDWFWDAGSNGPLVIVADEERRLNFVLGPRRLDIITEAPDLAVLKQAAGQVLAPCLDILGLVETKGCAATATWTLAAEKSADAEQALEDWLYHPHLRTTFEPLGGRPDDLVFEATFTGDGDVTTEFKAEPVTDEQASEGPFFLSAVEIDEFPPGALIVQVDRRQDQTAPADDAVERAGRHLDKLLDLTDRLLATLDARDDAS